MAVATLPSPQPAKVDFEVLRRANGHYLDPITADKHEIEFFPKDKPLNYNPIDKMGTVLQTAVLKDPVAIKDGLLGNKNFSFSSFMMAAKVPFLLGGGVLTGMYLLGGVTANPAIAMGIGVGLYMAGQFAAKAVVNTAISLKYKGLDIDQLYLRGSDKHYERMFVSPDWCRTDIMPEAQQKKLEAAFHIPEDTADKKGAVRDNVKAVISQARVLRLLLGNTFAAIGAGLIARDARLTQLGDRGNAALPNLFKALSPIVGKADGARRTAVLGEVVNDFVRFEKPLYSPQVLEAMTDSLAKAAAERVNAMTHSLNRAKGAALVMGGASLAYTVGRLMIQPGHGRDFQKPLATSNDPTHTKPPVQLPVEVVEKFFQNVMSPFSNLNSVTPALPTSSQPSLATQALNVQPVGALEPSSGSPPPQVLPAGMLPFDGGQSTGLVGGATV